MLIHGNRSKRCWIGRKQLLRCCLYTSKECRRLLLARNRCKHWVPEHHWRRRPSTGVWCNNRLGTDLLGMYGLTTQDVHQCIRHPWTIRQRCVFCYCHHCGINHNYSSNDINRVYRFQTIIVQSMDTTILQGGDFRESKCNYS